MKPWIAALAAVALLGGCVKMDKSPPKNLPDYVKLYPGAQPMMTMNLGVMDSEVETTSDSPATVLAWYRGQAAADGLTEKASPAPAPTNATSGQQQAQFSDASGGKILIVLAKPQPPGTMISLSYRPVKGPAQ